MKKLQKKPRAKWSMAEIMEAWGLCDHIHMGGPNYSFIEWQEFVKALDCVKSGKDFEPSDLVKKLSETMR